MWKTKLSRLINVGIFFEKKMWNQTKFQYARFLGHFLREGKILDPASHKRELTPYTRFIKVLFLILCKMVYNKKIYERIITTK
jgi:hypothetical protein